MMINHFTLDYHVTYFNTEGPEHLEVALCNVFFDADSEKFHDIGLIKLNASLRSYEQKMLYGLVRG